MTQRLTSENICGSVTYISWSIDLVLHLVIHLNDFLYFKNWRRPGVFVPLRALALVHDPLNHKYKKA